MIYYFLLMSLQVGRSIANPDRLNLGWAHSYHWVGWPVSEELRGPPQLECLRSAKVVYHSWNDPGLLR